MENKNRDELKKMSILSVITGSTLYGLDIETSDVDVKNIVKVPQPEIITLSKEWETNVFHDPDEEFHSIKKYLKLAMSQNPTVLEMIYAEPQFYQKLTAEGKELIAHRDLFLTTNCAATFSGYAMDQLMRIKNGLQKATLEDQEMHLRYVLEKMLTEMPQQFEGIQPDKIELLNITTDQANKNNVIVRLKEQEVELSQLGGAFSQMATTMKQFNKMNHRNKKPEKKLQKHAMHLVRLLLTGIHVLEKGELKVSMLDQREQLIAIRNGEMEWEDFFAYVDKLFRRLEQAKLTTKLPKQVDFNKANQLYKKLQG